nr:hypothetical protein GCM10020092_054070 [Actinoplanes digitatis]
MTVGLDGIDDAERRRAGPLQVIEDDHQRPLRRRGHAQQGERRLPEPRLLLHRVVRPDHLVVTQQRGELRRGHGDEAGVGSERREDPLALLRQFLLRFGQQQLGRCPAAPA